MVFSKRHIGPDQKAIATMLETIGVTSLTDLIDKVVPKAIRNVHPLNLPQPLTETGFLKTFEEKLSKNKVLTSYIGMGYFNCITPTVIQRNILENPAWYTAYTPYQAEIAQGRLEALINFQTTVIDLTGMEIANASLLDEGTAAAEAMSMLYRTKDRSKKQANKFFVDENTYPQTIEVLLGRAEPMGIEIVIGDFRKMDLTDVNYYGCLLQYPNSNGTIVDYEAFAAAAQENKIALAFATDLMALTLLKSPGEMGASVVVGTSQRFGIPLGYGGPHAAFFATKEKYKRQIPGRVIGVTQDKHGQVAYRMALQTREQHIRRQKATSNICTAQVLLAIMASMYAVYHGPKGLKEIANRIHSYAVLLENGLAKMGYVQTNQYYFDTLKVKVSDVQSIRKKALALDINLRYFSDNHIGISLDETTTLASINALLEVFAGENKNNPINAISTTTSSKIPDALQRQSEFLTHPVFHQYHSEHALLRYMKKLENKDISLVHSMIPLGSCTMKLNATTEMMPLSWSVLGSIHPFVPLEQVEGYHEMFAELSEWLSVITGHAACSLQPNSGAQGELAGIMVIRAYFHARGEAHRNITLIPASAHGTNPASAAMAGQEIVVVKCKENGDIDVEDLKEKAVKHRDQLMALLVTYPSTHGVFEERIQEICAIIHQNGGKVYMDGANMNAQVGLTNPGRIGADVCHLNLHKTFCIPHGGGGPGMGPITCTAELAPFLPSHPVIDSNDSGLGIKPISAAPYGSASILSISYAYIAMMGGEGLTQATKVAILAANYIKARLDKAYSVVYTGKNDFNAHELIIDCRPFKDTAKVTVTDIAKRLMDYGFHAPTVSFPIAGTLMIEPTESETKTEIDRFCDAMIQIRQEIADIETSVADPTDNLLHNAPHTLKDITNNDWTHPYSRATAVFPLSYLQETKIFPAVSRLNDAYGDRNLVCSCPPLSVYESEERVEELLLT